MNAMTPCRHTDPEDRRCLVAAGNDIIWCERCGGTTHVWPHIGATELPVDEARTFVCMLMVDSGRWKYTQLPNGDLYGEVPDSHPAYVTMEQAGKEYDRFAAQAGVRSVWTNVAPDIKAAFRLKVINIRNANMRHREGEAMSRESEARALVRRGKGEPRG